MEFDRSCGATVDMHKRHDVGCITSPPIIMVRNAAGCRRISYKDRGHVHGCAVTGGTLIWTSAADATVKATGPGIINLIPKTRVQSSVC